VGNPLKDAVAVSNQRLFDYGIEDDLDGWELEDAPAALLPSSASTSSCDSSGKSYAIVTDAAGDEAADSDVSELLEEYQGLSSQSAPVRRHRELYGFGGLPV
jgi:hypothetical protein